MFRIHPTDGLAVLAGGRPREQVPPITGSIGYSSTPFPGGGVMGVNSRVRVADLRDGATNTVLIDELRIGPSGNDLRGTWALGQSGASLSAGNGRDDTPRPNHSCDTGCDDVWAGDDRPDLGMGACTVCENWQASAKSRHPGGVNAALADGSVRFVRDATSQLTWFLLHSRNDGRVVPGDGF
jgi:prepilin-type processing-associated H-X9-DG protein